MKKRVLLFSLFAFTSCMPSFSLFQKKEKELTNYDLPGQTAPPDMIFIKSNGELPSFYISKTLEPNINYIIYLEWLMLVYGETYPEYVFEAFPISSDSTFENYNDEKYFRYMLDPTNAYLPVLGLTWLQIQRYLAWKTDRLNEEILIKTGILNRTLDQNDENSFCTESYLTGQYTHGINRNIKDKRTGGERTAKISDGILCLGLRLPTETEWELAEHYFERNDDFDKELQRNNQNFLVPYHQVLSANHNVDMQKAQFIHTYSISNRFFSYNSNSVIGNATRYRKKFNDYSEWLLDKYDEDNFKNKNWVEVLKNGGFSLGKGFYYFDTNEFAALLDPEMSFIKKDKYGKMQNFRYIGKKNDGFPVEVGRYEDGYKFVTSYYLSKIKTLYLSKYPQLIEFDTSKSIPKVSHEVYLKYQELNKRIDEINNTEQDFRPLQRVIKSKNGRDALLETKTSTHVGFRCVLPFTGEAVLKGYKVRWN